MGPLGSLTSVTGGGGLQGGAGISETGDQKRSGGNVFNFAPPPWVTQSGQQQASMQWGLVAVAALGAVWLLTRK